ncbi:hypothetical protein GQ53DRAFT_17270 [Thozetella sp. PMI_491]|nr:hypothetical protein GQ53DRAFT_17270 [Thozetella sp. PMI_491]
MIKVGRHSIPFLLMTTCCRKRAIASGSSHRCHGVSTRGGTKVLIESTWHLQYVLHRSRVLSPDSVWTSVRWARQGKPG